MSNDKRIIIKYRIKDLERQKSSHTSAKSRAKTRGDKQRMKFEQTCIDDCDDRIQKAQEELQGL